MTTVAAIQSKLKEFDTKARKAKDTDSMSSAWKSVFGDDMSDDARDSFLRYYRDMTKTVKQRGGMAPLNYQMTPGAYVKTFAEFPTEAATDAASIRNMDVYFTPGVTKSCGIEDSTPIVPVSIGTNQVGGSRFEIPVKNRKMATLRKNRKGKKASRAARASRAAHASRNSRKSRRMTYRRKQRGGNLLASLLSRPVLSTAPPGMLSTASNSWQGVAPAPSSNPVNANWTYNTTGREMLFNPQSIARIGDGMDKLANPPVWNTMT